MLMLTSSKLLKILGVVISIVGDVEWEINIDLGAITAQISAECRVEVYEYFLAIQYLTPEDRVKFYFHDNWVDSFQDILAGSYVKPEDKWRDLVIRLKTELQNLAETEKLLTDLYPGEQA